MSRLDGFIKDPEVERLHGDALSLMKSDHAGAHQLLGDGLDVLRKGPHELDEPSARMQAARVVRDDGFVHVREAIAAKEDQSDYLELGLSKLKTSEVFLQMLKERPSGSYSPEARRFLRSEYGATLDTIGRLATVAYLLDVDLGLEPMDYYEPARVELAKGDNRYYEARSLMAASLFRAAQGRQYTARVWAARAEKVVERAAETDSENAVAARKAYQSRIKAIETPRKARNSILRNP